MNRPARFKSTRPKPTLVDNRGDFPEPPFSEQKTGPPPGLEGKMLPRPQYWNPSYKVGKKLTGKSAIVTGGDSGIGRSVALYFALEGADVGIVYLPREQSDADETKDIIESVGGKIALYPGDLRDPNFCKEVTRQFAKTHNGIDILVNNAAAQEHIYDFSQLSIEHWDTTFKTNIYPYFYMASFSLPYFNEAAAIINTGSITAMTGSSGLIDYSATKGAIEAFTRSLAKNLASKNIRVNCVVPGPVWTPLNPAERPPKEIENFGKDSLKGRPAQPFELAPAYVFLASEADSSYINGEMLVVNAGPC